MAGENNQNGSLVGKSQNLPDLGVKRAAGKEAAPPDQSLEVQSKPIFDPFSCEPSSPTDILVIQDNSADSDSVVKKIDTTSQFSRH
jgi:hypothetical protein